jgi:hypothetical protein
MAGILPVNDVIAALCNVPEHAEAQAAEPCGQPCDDDCGTGCAEKHCAPLDHHCRCCVAGAIVPEGAARLDQFGTISSAFAWEHTLVVSRTLTPPTRPPIP